jgi:hypothetical protein
LESETTYTTTLFFLHWIIIFGPFHPATLEGIDLRISHPDQFLCHPGTRSFIGSGAVENDDLLLGVFLRPGIDLPGFFSNGPLNFQITVLPIAPGTDIQKSQIGIPK